LSFNAYRLYSPVRREASQIIHMSSLAVFRPIKRFVKWSPLWPILRPRRFQAYCVGPAKSGTVSVSGLFSRHFRSGHEVAFRQVVEMAVQRYEGGLTKAEAMRQLRKRDREFRLEMDSFNQLSVFAEELVEMFPQALFVLTVREPQAWLNSIINQHLRVDVSHRGPERRLRQLFFGTQGGTYSQGEEELERLGLFSLDGYLGAWSNHYERILERVPRERLLVVRTEALSTSRGRLAHFLSIPPEMIDNKRSHLHRCPQDHGVVSRIPQNLLEARVDELCGDVSSRLNVLADVQGGTSGGNLMSGTPHPETTTGAPPGS